ncbi:acyl carrier protein, partial [Lactococcus lactis]
MAVFEKVQDIIVDELGKEKEEVTLETSFEELDADSLDLFQIINDIEDEFDVEVDTEADMKTVADL